MQITRPPRRHRHLELGLDHLLPPLPLLRPSPRPRWWSLCSPLDRNSRPWKPLLVLSCTATKELYASKMLVGSKRADQRSSTATAAAAEAEAEGWYSAEAEAEVAAAAPAGAAAAGLEVAVAAEGWYPADADGASRARCGGGSS